MDKICGFYVSNIHLATMILPFIKEQIQNEVNIESFFEEDLSDSINKVLNNLMSKEKYKQKILDINWKNSKFKKYVNMEKHLKGVILDNTIILVSGNKKYINETGYILNKYFEKYFEKYFKNNKSNNIKIINLYKVTEFDDNISEILDNHKYILNTSGIHKIEEVFEEYKKAN